MLRVEAEQILTGITEKKPVLNAELAEKMRNAVGAGLDDSVVLKDLYCASHTTPDRRAGEEWYEFLLSLTAIDKRVITRSLGGLTYNITVGDIRDIKDFEAFKEQRGIYLSIHDLSFFKLALERKVLKPTEPGRVILV